MLSELHDSQLFGGWMSEQAGWVLRSALPSHNEERRPPRDPGILLIMACPSYQPECERLSPSHMTLHCPVFVPPKSLSLSCFYLFNPLFIRLHPLAWLWGRLVCWVPSYHPDPWASSPFPAFAASLICSPHAALETWVLLKCHSLLCLPSWP